MQQQGIGSVPVVKEPYLVEELGAPFNVFVVDGVVAKKHPKTGRTLVSVTDTVGLINAVVRVRVRHPRKLSGAEIKFIRKAINVKAKDLAETLEISAEHLSRCESGTAALSPQSEKLLRLTAYIASYSKKPESPLAEEDRISINELSAEEVESLKKGFDQIAEYVTRFLSMKIQAIHAVEPLSFTFSRVHGMNGLKRFQRDEKWVNTENIAA